MAIQDILERKEILLKLNDMNNEEKAREIVNKFIPNDDFDTAMKYDLAKIALLHMAQWKDEQFKQLLIEKNKLLSPSTAQDSVKRCMIEEIYREMFNEEIPNTNPYMK